MNSRNRTPSEYIEYGLYLYFLGLSFKSVAKVLSFLHIVKRSHVSIWTWIQKHTPQKISSKKKKVSEYSCILKDEKIIKAGSEYTWLWVAIEPKDKEILGTSI